MNTSFGKNIRLTITGGSHDEKMTLRLERFPAGQAIDQAELQRFLSRRAPGHNAWSTQRQEADQPHFIQGLAEDVTTGEAIVAEIYNQGQHSVDYHFNDTPRPGHADFTAVGKYGPSVDLRGGGHFSGRLTAPYCLAGGLCRQYLAQRGVIIIAHLASVGSICDRPFDLATVSTAEEKLLAGREFPVLDEAAGKRMQAAIAEAKAAGDSLGGVIECAVLGLPVGLGEHMFASVEARIGDAVFAIPAVKGVEFGSGFGAAALRGSENNDPFATDGQRVYTTSNHCGGILGGISNGMPLVFRIAVKPTPSISQEQDTVSLSRMEPVKLRIQGRHDPCIAPRAVPVAEAAAALAITDLFLDPHTLAEATDLSSLRQQIDDCDQQLTALFCQRMQLSSQVAVYKQEHGLPVLDAARERALLLRIAALAEPEQADASRVLYSTILSLSRAYQQKLLIGPGATAKAVAQALTQTPSLFPESAVVAVQGVEGSYGQRAAEKLFSLPEIHYQANFEQVFQAVAAGRCRYGILPIENSTAGSVSRVYDLLGESGLFIVRAARIKIDHCLLAKAGTDLSEITRIYSHEQAIDQCRGFLSTLPGVTVTACANTAQAAQYAANSPERGVAALASQSCASLYGLSLLATSVQNSGNNHTRFLCVAAQPEIYPGADKTTVMTVIENRPGSLYDLLSQFYVQGVNLTKLESRPIPEKDFEFRFCLDFETPVYSPRLPQLLTALERQSEGFRYLGTYSEMI